MGFEPIRSCELRFLRPLRLPLRHPGLRWHLNGCLQQGSPLHRTLSGSVDNPPVRIGSKFTSRHLALAMLALLVAWLVLVGTGAGQEFPNDYAAFYSMARGMRLYGLGINSQLYSVHFQYLLESFIRNSAGVPLAIPFVNPPLAAWIVIPFSWLPLRASFLAWDACLLIAAVIGLRWLADWKPKVGGLGLVTLAVVSSYPAYLALGMGQYDLLWPPAAALLASSMLYQQRVRYVPRAAVAALLLAIKPDLFLAFLIPAIAGRRRPQVKVAALTLLLIGGATAFILGPTGLAQAAHIELYTIGQRFPPTLDMTVTGLAYRVLGPGPGSGWVGLAAIPLALLAFGYAWWRNPPQTQIDWFLCLASTSCLSLLIAPHDLVQGLLLLGPAAILVAKALRSRGRSLVTLGLWILGFDLATVVDMTPHLYLHFRITPLLLLAAVLTLWRARPHLATVVNSQSAADPSETPSIG